MISDPSDKRLRPEGALLDAGQIRLLKKAIVVMSVLLVVGFLTVLGRIGFLMTRGETAAGRAAPTSKAAAPASTSAAWLGDLSLTLPAGDQIKSTTVSGHQLVVHHAGPAGETVTILDLTTGRVASRIKIDTAR